MTKVVYGLETGSIEDAAQCVIIDIPDWVFADATADYIEEHWEEGKPVLPA